MQLFIDIDDIEGLEDELEEINQKIDRQDRLRLAILACLSESDIDAELLKQLVASTPYRPELNQVLWYNGFLYATNGHIAAKIEAQEQDTSKYCDSAPVSVDGETIKTVFESIKPAPQKVLVNPKYLKIAGELFEYLGVNKVTLGVRGPSEALTFIGEKETGESIELIVMPVKTTT